MKYRSKQNAEGRIKMKMCESNSTQSLSLIEIPTATLPHIPLSLTKFMAVSPPAIPVMAAVLGNCFWLLNGQPLSHMEYGQSWLPALAADGPLSCFKTRDLPPERMGIAGGSGETGDGCWKGRSLPGRELRVEW